MFYIYINQTNFIVGALLWEELSRIAVTEKWVTSTDSSLTMLWQVLPLPFKSNFAWSNLNSLGHEA